MTTKQIERLVSEKFGTAIEMEEFSAGARWKSKEIATTDSNAGCIFSKLMKDFTVEVSGPTSTGAKGYEDWYFLRLNIHWQHRSGGRNGDSIDIFYHIPTDKFMEREEANVIFDATSEK